MRRLILIFLLTLLPLQASWAAMCAYCPDECISEFATTAQEPSGDAAAPDFDGDCRNCQLGGVGIAAALPVAGIVPPPPNLALVDGSAFTNSSEPDRPERPNWMRAA